MSSVTTNRPTGAMTTASRPTRFPEFGAAPGRHNSESSQSSTLGQKFGNGAAWQPSGGIWSSNPIGSGYAHTKKDTSRSTGRWAVGDKALAVTDDRTAGNDGFSDALSGSKALAEQSEADPWDVRTNGPWNHHPDTTSPTMQSNSGSTSPSHTRNSIPNVPTQAPHEIHNPYQQSRPPIGQGPSFRSQTKSSLNPSSGSFNFVQKPKPSFSYNDDKENSYQYGNDVYDDEIPSRYLAVGSVSRDSSIPPLRTVESGHNGASVSYASGNLPFGSTVHHTPKSSIHSQRPSTSGPVGSYNSQSNGLRYELAQSEADLSEKFAGFSVIREAEGYASQVNNGNAYPPNNPTLPQNHSFTQGSPPWGDGHGTKLSISYDTYSAQPFAEQATFLVNKGGRFTEKGSVLSAGSEHRRGLSSPKYYSAAGTPPSGQDQVYRPNSRGARAPQGPAELSRKLQDIHIQQQAHAYAHYMYNAQYGHFLGNPYDGFTPSYRPTNVPYGYPLPMPAYPSGPAIPTCPAKDQDIGAGVRSVLLEEFRSNSKANKKYELRDIYNHVVEFSGDQHGSRFIQNRLETANSDEKEQLFREIQPNALQLMTDVFGNYVIQKLFEHGNQVQKRVLAEQMKNHVLELSLQMYGCRVVQKALEHVLADQQAELAQELRADVLKCVKDQNGNHVVQKAIERVPTEHVRFIIEAFRGQVHTLAVHPYGCRVIQRILEYCKPHEQVGILEELHQCTAMLITDQYGNYVTQHVIEHGQPEDQAKVIRIVTSQLLELSKHKFASNVVEKCIEFGTHEQRRAIVNTVNHVHSNGISPLQLMIKDPYGNYVIQRIIGQLNGAERDGFVNAMKPQLTQLKKYTSGKQIAALEKLIYTPPRQPHFPASISPTTQPLPIDINSIAATPMLTNGQNSPQSTNVSTNVSTVDDSTEGTGPPVKLDGPIKLEGLPSPEVVLNEL
ncbi:pumilio domain-containing protein [Drepanopeziza brunnea f. sp. 'multigermtubi' MB_m1]|uniref:Pumilio homology domain family member 3 n=1 Tax=Marssonina brunnea f. sp. multigermtubi (strain MB_m1) TaxID=1072389 RepID=K1WR55_MARBU|nr:pumilio domain-containing protein [Drepanopeziza brunnea f. sp. 'multigermtubi' MB_m1]EKD14867.1 pumilio domain-containing protein [Drepanopeziza brunnea f. sp. 'multigermtubi' MB_m1]